MTKDLVQTNEGNVREDRQLTVYEMSAIFPQISRPLLRQTIT